MRVLSLGAICEVSEQQRDSLFDLVGNLYERGIRRCVVVAGGARVGHAPMGYGWRAAKLWAGLAHFVAQGDDAIESAAGEPVD
jgi:hypothetical protein